MLGVVAPNFVSKHILQFHIDVTCKIEELKKSETLLEKNLSYNHEDINIDHRFF
jgi:hypothetical protein